MTGGVLRGAPPVVIGPRLPDRWHVGPGCLWPHGCSGLRRAQPPARLGVLTSFGAAPRSPPVPSGPSGALHTSGAWCADVCLCVVSKPGQAPPPPTGTAAWPCGPSGALHTSGTWCADVCLCVASKPGQVPLLPGGVMGVSRVEFLGCSGASCYKRRQSKVFFVWLSAPLLQTSSIRGLFR